MSLKILILSLILSIYVINRTIAANETQNSDGNETIDLEIDSEPLRTQETPYALNFTNRTPPEYSPTPNISTTELYDIDPGFNAPDLRNVTFDPSWLESMPKMPPAPWENQANSDESEGMDGFSIFLILFIVLAFIGITIFVAFIIVDIHRRYRRNTEERERYIIEKHRQLDRVGNPKTPHEFDDSKSKSLTQRSFES